LSTKEEGSMYLDGSNSVLPKDMTSVDLDAMRGLWRGSGARFGWE
jgi:hypothetical protein